MAFIPNLERQFLENQQKAATNIRFLHQSHLYVKKNTKFASKLTTFKNNNTIMRIIFHPSFDRGYYKSHEPNSQDILGTQIVGIQGMLEHLSLYNGLSGQFASDGERAAAYLAHVAKWAKGTIIETAFTNDNLGVAKRLLEWRDALIMAGWEAAPDVDDDKPKLQLLANIESTWKGDMKGDADRWHDLLILSQKQRIIEDNDTIDCRCAKEQLPFVVQQVLEACNAVFAEYPDNVQIPDNLKIKIKHYKDLTDVYRQVAANMEDYKDCVIINRDNVSLNHSLFAWGEPLLNANIEEANPLTLQLFKLAMSLFSRPLNINDVLSYLQLPVGPVPRKLRSALAYILATNGGFGEIDWNDISDENEAAALKRNNVCTLWDKTIYDYIETDDNATSLDKKERKAKAELLKYITDKSIEEGKDIPVEILKDYIGDISGWANRYANSGICEDDALKSQLGNVVVFFKQLACILGGAEKISYADLDKHVRTIYQPTAMTQAHAQVGALEVVSSYEQLVDTPKKLVWLDCSEADQRADQYEFLSAAERQWLDSQDRVSIPTLKNILEFNRKEMVCAISKVKESVILVTSEYHHNQKLAEHPLVAELKMLRGDNLELSEGEINLPMSEEKEISIPSPKEQYDLGKINPAQRSESNTSIDTLINYPFDYTVDYIAHLGKSSKNDTVSPQKAKGLVAHHVVQSLVSRVSGKDGIRRIAEMKDILKNDYEAILQNSINVTGLILLLKENQMEYNSFKDQLKRSIDSLILIMEHHNLFPVGCELKYENPLGETIGDFNARIDLVLNDAEGRAVIFDLKWSYSDYYGNKIKDGKALQLDLYRKELEESGKMVSAVGYYLMPKCQLDTPDFETYKDKHIDKIIINHIDPPQGIDIFTQIENSVKQRRDEIENGSIEEGEGMDILQLPYSQAYIKHGGMLLVGQAQKKRATKVYPSPAIDAIIKDSPKIFTAKPEMLFTKTYEFSKNDTPLNETETTYPLMKGRLK